MSKRLPEAKGGNPAMTGSVRRRKGVEVEPGFTMIELLIVIVVLGILAATVVFALEGVAGQSAQAACQSDAKTYEIAVAAYESAPKNTTNAAPTSTNELTGTSGTTYGAFLRAPANNSHYVVALAGDGGAVKNLGTGTIPAVNATTERAGTVNVGPPNTTLIPYDSQTSTTGCGQVQ
jgi:prepilin-type N-terminal cleavage/methylation domain-containing protein